MPAVFTYMSDPIHFPRHFRRGVTLHAELDDKIPRNVEPSSISDANSNLPRNRRNSTQDSMENACKFQTAQNHHNRIFPFDPAELLIQQTENNVSDRFAIALALLPRQLSVPYVIPLKFLRRTRQERLESLDNTFLQLLCAAVGPH